MSSLDLEQTVATQKASLDRTFGLLNKAIAGFQKFVSLNRQEFKSTLAENQEIAAKALSVKDLQELLALQASQVQLAVEKAQSYWRHVYEITAIAQAEFTETIEAQFNRYPRDVQAFIDNLAKNAPTGSEAVLSASRSVMETVSSASEAARKAAKLAVETAENNVSAALDAPTRSARPDVEQTETDEKK
ncbi:phasin family protein [Trinickia violacea]|uniref:Phasin family protein n=1 Tax=Trinickia violacea TaxID=2571746 RepID=A0A4P8IQS5_9BURK|nr:TIGR01841 family phasin [Trinickia violacea]QCP48309.1 phasin family protein [Trinickia violacea]